MDAATILGIGSMANLVVANPSSGVIPKEDQMAEMTPGAPGLVSNLKQPFRLASLKRFGMATTGFVGANIAGAVSRGVFGSNYPNVQGFVASGVVAGIAGWFKSPDAAMGAGLNAVRHLIFGLLWFIGSKDIEDAGKSVLSGNNDMAALLQGMGVGSNEAAELLNGLTAAEAEQLLGAISEMSPADLRGLAGDAPGAVLNGDNPGSVLNGNDLLERLLTVA